MTILYWLIIVNLAVMVHELSHLAAARAQGVRVKAFSLGMGPILWRRTRGDIEWRLSALPLGGYVDIEGLAATPGPDGNLVQPSTGMARLSWLGKAAILAAGPLSNIVLAILLVAGVLTFHGVGKMLPGPAHLQSVVAGSPAEKAGLQAGDAITILDGQPVTTFEQVRAALRANGTHRVTVQRDGGTRQIAFTWAPSVPAGGTRPLFGIAFAPTLVRVPASEALWTATSTLIGGIPPTVAMFGKGFIQVFSFSDPKREPADSRIMGPVGTVGAVSDFAQDGFAGLVTLAGLLSLSLGVFNLLPIPGLDGGRLALVTFTSLRRRPLAPGQEELINFLGFSFVIAFIVLVTFRDLSRLGS
ncbi:MAG TPA: M50 family metallopeptidase [Deinococcales bacterium]|nr:M50 family metallopeptidase [Deinococcales bacterium]